MFGDDLNPIQETLATENTDKSFEGLVVLFDDERSFIPGFRDNAVVLRTIPEAADFFEEVRDGDKIISELWLDFVIHSGNVTEALRHLPGEAVESAFYHSSAIAGKALVEFWLKRQGFTGELELPEEGLFQ